LVHSLGFVIVEIDSPKAEPIISSHISTPSFFKSLVLADQLPLLIFKPIKDYYSINEWDSPVISLDINRLNENKLSRGRFYFLKETFQNEAKNTEFIKKAQLLFKQFKKTFPDPKLEGYQNFWVSPQAAELHKQGVVLVK
jgi:hypothetical protein